MPLVFTTRETSPALILWLAAAGLIAELLSRYFIAAAMQISHGRAKHRGQSSFIPALSIEHLMERMMLFVILTTGEILIVSSYTATSDSIGPVRRPHDAASQPSADPVSHRSRSSGAPR